MKRRRTPLGAVATDSSYCSHRAKQSKILAPLDCGACCRVLLAFWWFAVLLLSPINKCCFHDLYFIASGHFLLLARFSPDG